MRTLAILISFAALISCSAQDIASNEQLLVGGAPVTDEKNFPATVGLFNKLKLCTGTKIGPRQILTAAHCVTDKWGRKLAADGEDFGLFTYNSISVPPDQTHRERRIRTRKTIIHPNFWLSNPGPDDIAIIVTQEELDWIPQARLELGEIDPGRAVLLAGYGCENGRNVSENPNPRLKYATSTTASPVDALNDLRNQPWFRNPIHGWFRPIVKAGNMHILRGAAAGESFSTCPGDSGGPLFLDTGDKRNPPVIGITSFSANGGANLARWSFFVKINRHVDWLTKTLSDSQ